MSDFSFLYMTDTHVGNDGSGWGHHPIRPDLMPQLLSAVEKWISKHPVDMILHGGDIIDNGEVEAQLQAKKLWSQLSVPTRLCLGNHDVAREDALETWLVNVPEFFPGGKYNYMIECGPVDLYVLAGGWMGDDGVLRQWWNKELPDPGVFPEQIEWFESTLSARLGRNAILAVHASLDPLPPALTGLAEPGHIPPDGFLQPISAVLDRYPNVKLVLSGHCHATCMTDHGSRIHTTLSAFCEPSFQLRCVSINDSGISVHTFTPVDHEKLDVVFNPENSWSVGRKSDLDVDITFDDSVAKKTS